MGRLFMNFLNTICLDHDISYQNTVNSKISFSGVGIHNGKAVSINLLPADENTGVVFVRTDLKKNNVIPVNYNNLVKSKFCSKIKNEFGVSVSTVEHLLSTLKSLT